MRPTAATRSRIGCRVALRTGWRVALRTGWRVALLGECERGGSKRDSDCDAKSFHGAHFVFSLPNQLTDNARRERQVPQLIGPYWLSILVTILD
jgi:hypothetical protein